MSKVSDIAMGVLVPPALLSCFLPSPSTAYDKTSGAISAGDASLSFLRRGEVIGTGISIAVAAAISLAAVDELGPHAAWIFLGALAVLAIFLFEYERAFRIGRADAEEGR